MHLSYSISNRIFNGLELNNCNKADVSRIMEPIFGYLLGFGSYSNCCNLLKEFGSNRSFSRLLKTFTDKEIKYILIYLRRYAKKRKSKIVKKNDKLKIKTFHKLFNYNKIKIIKDFPKQNDVLTNVTPTIINIARSLNNSIKWDYATGVDDFLNELLFKASQSYKLYIYSYGIGNFNDKVLYSCILKGLHTRKLDMIGSNFKNKRVINMYSDHDIKGTLINNYSIGFEKQIEPLDNNELFTLIREFGIGEV